MKTLPTVFASLAIGTAASSAATIAWSSTLYTNTPNPLKNIMGVDQFAQLGTQIFAVNLNGPAMTMSQSSDLDITFTSSSPDLDTSALTLTYGSYFANPGAGNNDILRTGVYQGGGSQSITLNNLTSGNTYSLQALIADGRGGQSGRRVSFDEVNQGDYANGIGGTTWGDSLLVTGVFVADSASQSFVIQNFNSNGTNAGSQLNAVLLHETAVVPEPSGVALLGLGWMAMAFRRR